MTPKLCLICTIEVDSGIRSHINNAKKFEKFNGDSIPVCDYHYNQIKKENFLENIFDGESNE